MLKLREPFSQKIHLHIRQNMLQRLWDKYVPASSPAYEQIQLVYLKGALEAIEQQPERVQLLIQLILRNKMMQLNLMQYPALVKVGQKQMEHRLHQIERYYAAQLKSCDFTMFRTVKQYFALLEQAQEGSRRYQGWQNSYREIEKQREEYRLLSLFSVKLREFMTEHSVNTLRTMEREFVHSLSETEYQTLSEELIWQEKPELITYLKACDTEQCEKIINVLEKEVRDVRMREVLKPVFAQPVKENFTATVERLEQKEFCLFYHHVMEVETVVPQMVVWKENKTEMLRSIDRLESVTLQQMWNQMEEMTHPLGQNITQIQGKEVSEQNTIQIWGKEVLKQDVLQIQEKVAQFLGQNITDTLLVQEKDVVGHDTLQTLEKELVYSLMETEYQTLAEEFIWREKAELIAYLKECNKARCKEIVKELEKDIQMKEVLASVQKQSVRKRLVGAARKLKQNEFSRFYWQVVDMKGVNPPLVIWKKNRTEMLHSIDELKTERLQEMRTQLEAVSPVNGMKHIFSEKMIQLKNQYQQTEVRNIQEQISVVLEENDLEKIADIVNIEQLMQDFGKAEEPKKGLAGSAGESELLFKESDYPVLWDGVYQVIQKLEQEQEIRREQIEQQQEQVVAIYQEAYHQIWNTEAYLMQRQEITKQLVEQTFLERHQEELTKEEVQNICEWSKAFFEVRFVKQGQPEIPIESSVSSDEWNDIQSDKTELVHMIQQINQYIEEQHGSEEKLTLNWQEGFSNDERIQNVLVSVRKLEKEQRQKLTQYLADMIIIWQEVSSSEHTSLNKGKNAALLPDTIKSAEQLKQESLIQDNTYEFAERVLRTGDREFAEKLLQIEDREFAERLLRLDNKALAEALLRIEDREIVEKFLQTEDQEIVEKFLQDNEVQLLDVPYGKLWEWGETLLFHPEHQQEWEDADLISGSGQEVVTADAGQQEDVQTQVIRHQIAMAKDRNHLQRLIRQINHQADTQLVYTDAQLRLPQVQTLLNYIRQLDEKQYGVLVKELAQITKMQKVPYDKPETTAATDTVEENKIPETRTALPEQKTMPYPVLVQRIQNYEKQHSLELYRDIEKIEQKIFPQIHEKHRITSYEENETDYIELPYEEIRKAYGLALYEEIGKSYELPSYDEAEKNYGMLSYEETGSVYGQIPYEEAENRYGLALFEEAAREYLQPAPRGKQQQENRYQSQKLEYSLQKGVSSEDEQQRAKLRMQQETAQIKSVQEQLGKKLKEVEHQLKKVENSTKAKENVSVFAEQVKRQLYEELHVEKLRRGLI